MKPVNYLNGSDLCDRSQLFNGRVVIGKSNGIRTFFINRKIVKGRYKGCGYVGEYIELMSIRRFKINFNDVMSWYRDGLSYFSPSVLIWKIFHNKFRKNINESY